MRGRSTTKIAALSVAALFTAGCLSEGDDGGGGGGGGGGGEGDGSVEIFGAFGGAEAEAFEASLAPFIEESGLDVTYVPSSDFTTAIRARVQGNDAPDIAIFPQPGLLVDLAESGDLVPLDDVLDLDALKETVISGMIESTETEEGSFGVPMRMAAKSIIWSPAPEFEEAGYTAATTQDELLSLTEEIRESGTAPWCFGMESGQATGWVATDWLEEYVLRIGGEEFYNQWARHEVPFNDPIVVEAAEVFAETVLAEGNVLGGRGSIASSFFGTSGNPMFEDPPQCYLHRQ
ncbi:MAG: ABC transporter substrate-binding protein, partial [Actinomycetota bacterium]|nr:ABC transporter substrate-binding protein [Actinomycetota bacterium]